MLELRVDDIRVQFDRGGSRHFSKNGMHNWVGLPVLLTAGGYLFNFDLAGRIQRIDGLPSPHSWDWLQRSMANDWTYYDRAWVLDGLTQPSDIIGDSAWPVNGRTDLPLLEAHGGLRRPSARNALAAFDALISSLRSLVARRPPVYSEDGAAAPTAHARRLWDFLHMAALQDRACLQNTAQRLHAIHGGMLALPPETIQVDYRVLLVKLIDGCTNACPFCTVRGEASYALRSQDDIERQIDALADLYGPDLYNYNSVVFGECDALASPEIDRAARRAYAAFRCGDSYHEGSNLFLFATNKTLLDQTSQQLDRLEALPFDAIHINVGWEAATEEILARLGKPQTAADVLEGMTRAGTINRTRPKLNISGNFIAADNIVLDSVAKALSRTGFTGQVYLSPLLGHCGATAAIDGLRVLRRASPGIRAHLYTMQRL